MSWQTVCFSVDVGYDPAIQLCSWVCVQLLQHPPLILMTVQGFEL